MHSLQLHCQLKAPGKGIQWLLQGAPTSQSGADGEHQCSQGPSYPEGRRWAADNHSPSHKSIICKLQRMHPSQPHCLCCRTMQRKTSRSLLLGTLICCQTHSLAKAVQAEGHHSLPRSYHVLRGCVILRGCKAPMGRGCSALGAFAPLCRGRASPGTLPCLGTCLLRGVPRCRRCQRQGSNPHKHDAGASIDTLPCLLICTGSCRNAGSTLTPQTTGCGNACAMQRTAACSIASTAGNNLSALGAALPITCR